MLLIPILISAAVNSYSNWYNFKEKEKEFIYNAATNLVDENFQLEVKNDFLEDKIKVFNLIIQRKSKIFKTYNQFLQNNKIEISQDKLMDGFAIEISKNLGTIEAYRNIDRRDSISLNTFVSYLISEREFIESIRANNITDATLHKYYQTEFRLLKENELDKKNSTNNLKRSKIKEKKISDTIP